MSDSSNAGQLKMGENVLAGNGLGGYFVYPKSGRDALSTVVITGTGIQGMKAAKANLNFAGASGFRGYLFFSIDIFINGAFGLVDVEFFDND